MVSFNQANGGYTVEWSFHKSNGGCMVGWSFYQSNGGCKVEIVMVEGDVHLVCVDGVGEVLCGGGML